MTNKAIFSSFFFFFWGGGGIEKAESCQENLWKEIQLKGSYRQKQTQEQNEKEWASSAGLYQRL